MPAAPSLPEGLLDTLHDILGAPVAPYAEAGVEARVRGRLAGFETITVVNDAVGNVLVRYRPKGCRLKTRMAFQAHMDHPGFRCLGKAAGAGKAALDVEMLGGMPPLCEGGRLRFYFEGAPGGVCATIGKVVEYDERRGPKRALALAEAPVPPRALGMWDYTPFALCGDGFAEGRGFDDTLGAATLVWLAEQAARQRWPQPFDTLLTRAEETGLVGCAELCRRRTLALPPYIVTVELPRAGGDTQAGGGVIARVGDGVSAYDRETMIHIDTLCRELERAGGFAWQRRLPGAGRTEASHFVLYGYRTGAVCLATVNAHNTDDGGRPAPERIALADLRSLAALLDRLAQTPFTPADSARKLKRALEARVKPMRGRLSL